MTQVAIAMSKRDVLHCLKPGGLTEHHTSTQLAPKMYLLDETREFQEMSQEHLLYLIQPGPIQNHWGVVHYNAA